MNSLWQDLHYGARMLMKKPGFTLIGVLTLALGIGANTAIFSVVNAVILKPLPYREPERLMKIYQISAAPGRPDTPAIQSYPRYQHLREQGREIADFAGFHEEQFSLTGTDVPERLHVEFASASYLPLLGVEPILGRSFAPEEDVKPATHSVALIGYTLWQRRFGGDPNVIGRTIEIEKRPLTIIGVLPSRFRGQSGTSQVWVPLVMVPEFFRRNLLTEPYMHWFQALMRLKPGVTEAHAQAALELANASFEKSFPPRSPTEKRRFRFEPLREASVDPAIRRSFVILLGAVGFVLLIACANVANLTLSRAIARQKEMAVRAALGASRGRLVRQMLTETVLLALIGGTLALLVAVWGVELLVKSRPGDDTQFWTAYSRTFDFFAVRPDGRVMAFNFTLAFITGLLCGLLPAWQASRPNLSEAFKDGAGSSTGGIRLRRPSSRALLVAGEVALSVVLLAGAGLMIKSLARLQTVRLGFVPEGVVTLKLGSREVKPEFYQELLARTAALPGVERVSVATGAPLMGKIGTTRMAIEGRPPVPDHQLPTIGVQSISPDYFKTLGIALLKGRSFTEQDDARAQRVAIISHASAAAYWPGEDPIGKRFGLGFNASYPNAGDWLEVVGVVDDTKYGRVEEAVVPDIYLSYLQPTMPPSMLIVRGNIEHAEQRVGLVAAVRREVRQLERDVPVYDVKTMTERSSEVTSRTRFIALLLGLLSGLALVLAATGIYGVMAYAVSARTREIGIRMALGAEPRDIFKLALGDGVALICVGLGAGLAGALAAPRVLTNQLYEVSATDPLTFAVIALLLTAVALLACWVPARRAAKVDPMIALRCD
jgi:putative ABC transport system permease protein